MSKQIIKITQECDKCGGTGLYVGMAERDGAAIVCHKCKGTGCYEFAHEYNEFNGRKERENVKRVYATNPGIGIGSGHGHTLEEFGGMPFEDWRVGKPFPPHSEMRKYTCPAWWYQCVDFHKKPDWDECMASLGVTFSRCPHFLQRETCWERWDAEQG